MSRLYRSEHTGSKTLVGLFMLVTASTTAMGTTQHYQANPAGIAKPAITSHLKEDAMIGKSRVATRVPRCTPGFTCNSPANRVAHVSRYEALKFALVMGAGASR